MWRHESILELERRWHPDARPYMEDALDEFETLAPSDDVYIGSARN